MNALPVPFSDLRFSPLLEQEFLDAYFEKSLTPLRVSLAVGALLYAVFGVLDAWLIPDARTSAWLIRYALICPLCLLTLAGTYSSSFKTLMQPVVAFLIFLSGAGLVIIMVIAHRANNYFYFGGLFLVIMYAYTFLKLRFVYAAASAWAVMLFYEVTAYWIGPPALPLFLYDNFLFLSANLIGMFSCYQSERAARKDFIGNRAARELEETKHLRERENLQEAVTKAATSLQESEAKFRTLAQTTTAAIFMHRGGNLIYANPAGETITGYSREELLEKNFWTLVDPEYVEMIKERAQARLRGEKVPTEYEFKIVRKDGEHRWVSMTAGIIEYEGQPGVIGTIFDITDRKRAAEAMERYNEALAQKVLERTAELEEAQKLAVAANKAKSDFLANISHELRTPLNSIIGFSEVMKDGMAGPLTDEQRDYLNDIWESGKHLLRLINDILDLSKIEAGMMDLDLSEISINELLEGCLFMFREKALRHGITLHTEIAEELRGLFLNADERKIKQVVLNLVANALKFSPDGSEVGVAAELRGQDVLITVWDKGIGIAAEDLDKLFRPFKQLDTTLTKKYEGTGLGLHLCKKIVELHGGSIRAESRPGAGSRFSFTIPRRN